MVISAQQDFVTASALAERQLYEWLTQKRYDTSALDEGRNEIAKNVTLDRDSSSGRHGAYTRWRMRETPSVSVGTWQSTLVVRADHRDDLRRTWIQVDVEHRPSAEGQLPQRAKTPGIARLLLDALDAKDGLAEVKSKPAFIEADDVDEVIEELCDEERRLPIVVASIPYGKDAETWADSVVEKAFSHLSGLAVLYVLAPEAQLAFNQALEYHPVFGGGIRTYLPGIDLAWKADAQRHPVMSRSTVEAGIHRAASTLAVIPQRLALRQPLPEPLDTLPIQRSRSRQQPSGSEIEDLRKENKVLNAFLDEAAQTESARVDEIRGLVADMSELEHGADSLRGENEELYEQFQATQKRVRFLQDQLLQAGQYDVAYAADETPGISYPASFAELLDHLPELHHIKFTGNTKITRALDAQSVDNWLQVAWDALLALEHFASQSAAGKASGDFRSWCHSSGSHAHPFPAAKVKMRESDTVGNHKKLRRERVFPVPESVHPDKEIYMQAHLRIGGGNTIAPRLHFHDDSPNTGLLYVGYLGPHLRNTLT
ncbi:hypothetical protein [Streptomyces sp. NPDC005078]|uniref:hypothetical protein n=1 Tax=unclassified Streptomyces TaxID=2593676 RepID=UPI0033B60BBB